MTQLSTLCPYSVHNFIKEMQPNSNYLIIRQDLCHFPFHLFPCPPFSFLRIKIMYLWLLKMLNLLQHVKRYNSLEGVFSAGNSLTNPTAERVSPQPALFSCGLQECGSHNDRKPQPPNTFSNVCGLIWPVPLSFFWMCAIEAREHLHSGEMK